MIRRASLALLATGTLGLALATPAQSGDSGGLSLTTSKHSDGPFSADVLQFNMEPVETKTAWIRVKNRTNDKVKGVELEMAQKMNPGTFTNRLFHGNEDITSEARQNGYKFSIDAGGKVKFKATIKNKEEGAMCFLVNANKDGFGDDTAYVAANNEC